MTASSNKENGSKDGTVMAPMSSDYNKLNASQSTVWKFTKPLFAKALEEVGRTGDKDDVISTSFRVADLGCATGGNSIAPLSFVASQVPTTKDLEIYMGDLPQNSWSAVVTTVTPETIVGDGRSTTNTFVYMVGRTFYDQCCPSETLDLSYCVVAAHWMKSYVGDIPSGLYATCQYHNLDIDSLQAWKAAGARDFAEFTRARHKELRVGGRFIGAHACPKLNGDNPWSAVGRIIYEILSTKVDSMEALAACVLPNCYRTEDDVRAGFQPTESGEQWELEVCEFHETMDHIREQLEMGEITPTEYGKAVVDSFRAVCHPTCLCALSKYMLREKAEQILKETYHDSVNPISIDPEKYNLDVSFWYVLARKL